MTNVMGDFVTKSPTSTSPTRKKPTGRTQQRQTKQTSSSGTSYRPPSSPPSQPRSSGPVERVTPPAPPPSVKDYLAGDEAYQQAIRGGQRSLQDFLSDLQRRRGETKTNYAQTQEVMENDRERQLEQLKQEFASRGLIHSGIYAGEQSQFQEDFLQQQQMMEQQFTQMINDLLAEQQQAKRQNELAMEQARQEALQRRATKYADVL